ncbi:MAG: tryptophan--tRNA ligase [Deltaproteobacteria bacterium]|nr:tryptophan--tRNA ligase [Deltaproteobacteria bacterium]
MKTSLTGIKPTGIPHLGNYFGAIRPALELAQECRSIYFIADYHALTAERNPETLNAHIYDVTATWLACGLDPQRTIVFRQSSVIEVFELTWIFACIVATGQLERGHSYKDALAKGEAPNAGLLNYPLLMAADIILYDTDFVPVGNDQSQHLELARDIAIRMNHLYGEKTVVVPQAKLAATPQVPGLDGRKMSKSYGNSIPLIVASKELHELVIKIKSDSTPLEQPKEPEGAHAFELFKAIASKAESQEVARKLRAGGYGWGHLKKELFERLDSDLAPIRERYHDLRDDRKRLDDILENGAERARVKARETISRVRRAVGIDAKKP